jgi:hypothetical protein
MMMGQPRRYQLIPIGMDQPSELIPIKIGWADESNSHRYWVSPDELICVGIGWADRINSNGNWFSQDELILMCIGWAQIN